MVDNVTVSDKKQCLWLHTKKEVMLRVFLNPLSGISSFFLFREVSEGERERNINYRMCWVSCLCHDKQQQSQSTAKSQKRARKMGKADRTMFVVEPFLFSFFSFCFFSSSSAPLCRCCCCCLFTASISLTHYALCILR